jgi:hypothetical protein
MSPAKVKTKYTKPTGILVARVQNTKKIPKE